MYDTKFPFSHQSHRIVGHLVISAVVGYFGWKLIGKIFFKQEKTSDQADTNCNVSIIFSFLSYPINHQIQFNLIHHSLAII